MPYRVVVIGVGFGGIGMAIALKQAGIEDFVVVDRADDLAEPGAITATRA
jgi:cation diffusion facilitator CzcD-associated flavoprotein CzcO